MSTNTADYMRWWRGHGPRPVPPGPHVKPTPWMDQANCAGMDTELMFPGRGDNKAYAAAKAVCAACPVATECLEYALEHGEHHGIWGGKSERERRRIRLQRRRQQGAA